MHNLVEGLLYVRHVLLEWITGLQGCRVLVLRNIEVAWHCYVVLEDILGGGIVIVGAPCCHFRLEIRAVNIEFIMLLLYNVVPSTIIESTGTWVLIFQVF